MGRGPCSFIDAEVTMAIMLVTSHRRPFFFFQAEDGIRDKLVTGVQTCALPISPRGVQTQHTPTRPPDNLNLVGVDRRAAAKYRLERFALNRPVASACDRKDVPHEIGRASCRERV